MVDKENDHGATWTTTTVASPYLVHATQGVPTWDIANYSACATRTRSLPTEGGKSGIADAKQKQKTKNNKKTKRLLVRRRLLTSTTGRNSSHRAFDAGLSSTCLRSAEEAAGKSNDNKRREKKHEFVFLLNRRSRSPQE